MRRAVSDNPWWRGRTHWEHRLRSTIDPALLPLAPLEAPADCLTLLHGTPGVGLSTLIEATVADRLSRGADAMQLIRLRIEPHQSAQIEVRVMEALAVRRRLRESLGAAPDPQGSATASSEDWWFLDHGPGINARLLERIARLRAPGRRLHGARIVLAGRVHPSLAVNDAASGSIGRPRRLEGAWRGRLVLPVGFRSFASLLIDDLEEPPRLSVSALTPAVLRRSAAMLEPWREDLEEAWRQYLQIGGLPARIAAWRRGASRDELDALGWQAADAASEEELRRSDWTIGQTRELFGLLAAGVGGPANHRALATAMASSPQTIKRRIEALHHAAVLWPVMRENALRPMPAAQAFAYPIDPALHPADPTALPDEVATRRARQQAVIAVVRALQADRPDTVVDTSQVLYHRTGTGTFIDVVGPDLGEFGIVVRDGDRGWRVAARTLRTSRWRGIVTTRSVLDLEDREVLAVPLSMLVWLIDT